MHYWEHLMDRILREKIHPRVFMNWGEESLIGDVTNVASITHRFTLSERTLQRYRLRLVSKLLDRKFGRTGKPVWLTNCRHTFR